uniref:Uncharacterized protein n=4 Tax=Aegilops tauschii subsp. strangulata TaxID=200361 RepID=A0A452Y909_AEGTS
PTSLHMPSDPTLSPSPRLLPSEADPAAALITVNTAAYPSPASTQPRPGLLLHSPAPCRSIRFPYPRRLRQREGGHGFGAPPHAWIWVPPCASLPDLDAAALARAGSGRHDRGLVEEGGQSLGCG